jgi:hypothetical protein
MKNELKSLLIGDDKQQLLKELIMSLKSICQELDLDFDLALDKSDPPVEFVSSDCEHVKAFPCGGDSVFCPTCNSFIVKGKMGGMDVSDYLKINHWR